MNKDGASKQSSSAAEFKTIKTLIMKTITLIFHCASYSEIKVIFEAFFHHFNQQVFTPLSNKGDEVVG